LPEMTTGRLDIKTHLELEPLTDHKRSPRQPIPQNSYYCPRPVPLEIPESGSFQISTKIKRFAGSWQHSIVGRTLVSAGELSLSRARLLAG